MIVQVSLQNETLITLSDVANHLPKRRGRKVHYSTIFRWAKKGVRGRILETMLIGGIRYTTLEALARFLNEHIATGPRGLQLDDVIAVNQALDEAGL